MAEDISGWLAQSGEEPDIAFGHAQYPSTLPSTSTAWIHLLETVAPTEPVLVVAPPYEISVIRTIGESLCLQGFMAFSYEEFLDFVKRERRGAGRGPEVWPRVSESDRLVVMVSIEPHMPADCAISLTVVVHWAADEPSGLSMRILTVSTLEDHPQMAALLRSKSMPEPKRFVLNLSQHQKASRVKVDTGEENEIEERVKSNVANQDGSQILVMFASDGPSQELAIYLKAQGWIVKAIDRWTEPRSLDVVSTASEEAMHRVLRPEELIRCPFPLTGFDHVHVIANSTSTKVVFDAVTGQLTSTLAQVSKQEREEQLAYAYRSQGASSVTVYINRPGVQDFLNAGTRLRRLQVSNEHLGGFIAALAGFEAWGIDALQVAKCFVPGMEYYALMTMMTRLINQELLRNTPGTGCLSLQIGDKEADVFKAVLPILGYDYRLAYFVAQHTDNTILQQSKLQLASLLFVGILDSIHFPQNMSDDLDVLASNCWGYTRPLAKQGAMWMALGLWKLAAKQHRDFDMEADVGTVTYLPVPGTSVHVSLEGSTKIIRTITKLSRALNKLHIGLIDIPTADETGELDEAGCLELQTHLFMAFLGQLIVGSPLQGQWCWQDVATDTTVVGFQSWVHWCVDFDEVHRSNGQAVDWGIFNGLIRKDRDAWGTDWTWIPGSIVAKYWDRQGSEVSLFSILRGRARPLWNYDEVLE